MAPASKTLLRRARIVTPQRTIEDADLLIDSGVIARIFEAPLSESTDAESEIDLRGQTLFPGFIDVHIHGAAGVDAMDARADDLLRVGDFLASHGVTSWLPTLVPARAEEYQRAVRAIRDAMQEQDGGLRTQARVLGVHYEGPFVN